MKLENFIINLAYKQGFSAAGIANVDSCRSAEAFRKWLDLGCNAGMSFLNKKLDIRADPRLFAPKAESIVVVGARYPSEEAFCAISNFARGRDYHHVIREKLSCMAHSISEVIGADKIGPICVDSSPLSEREWAVRAGLGWIGKQGSVVNPDMGCCFFLGELLLAVALEPNPEMQNQCADCDLCLKACPAGAIMSAGQVDARRCISYLTIEHKGEISPQDASLVGGSVFGCDRCTVVCPWNKRAKGPIIPEFDVAPENYTLEKIATLDSASFKKQFANTPVIRIGFKRFARNLGIALSNTKHV